jgi:hypothetical protein
MILAVVLDAPIKLRRYAGRYRSSRAPGLCRNVVIVLKTLNFR